MNTSNRIEMTGDFQTIFALASDVARWPEILPHYRWVKVLERRGDELKIEMAARHKGVPLWWRATQRVRPDAQRIEFTHVEGITKGMDVQWTFEPLNESTWIVQIHHQFSPAWPPVIGPWFAETIVGKTFVQQVAGKTLNRIKSLVEKRS